MLFAAQTFSGFHGISLFLLVAGVALCAAWLAVFAIRYLATFPDLPAAARPTNELRPESPAVANLLVNRWKPTRSAMAATLLDLAARKVFDIQQLDSHHFVIHLERVPADESTLTPYERQLLDFVRSRATGGSAPVEAITLGEEGEAEAWWKRFAKAIADDARRLGLARNRWAPRDWTILGGLLAIALAALAGGLALAHLGVTAHNTPTSSSSSSREWSSEDWLIAGAVAWALVMAWMRTLRALRDTPAGLAACSHWLGVRSYLRETASFDELPPAAVAIWDRYLGYGAALGAAHDAVHELPFAPDEPGVAWSRATGSWRQLRIEYPTRFGFGEAPGKVFLGGLVRTVFWGALAFVALPVITSIAWSIVRDSLSTSQYNRAELFIVLGLLVFVGVAGTYLAARFLAGVIRLVRGARDLGKEINVEGPVVKVHAGRVAVDDGKSEELVAWFPPPNTPALHTGMTIRAVISPHLHHVSKVTVLSGAAEPGPAMPQAAGRATAVASGATLAGAGAQAGEGVALTAVDVREITGLDLAPAPASAGVGSPLGLPGAAVAIFSDGRNTVAAAHLDGSGAAARMFEALSRVPGTHAQRVDGLAGDAWWLGGKLLIVHTGSSIAGVQTDLQNVAPDGRLQIAKALYGRMSGAPATAAAPPAEAPVAGAIIAPGEA